MRLLWLLDAFYEWAPCVYLFYNLHFDSIVWYFWYHQVQPWINVITVCIYRRLSYSLKGKLRQLNQILNADRMDLDFFRIHLLDFASEKFFQKSLKSQIFVSMRQITSAHLKTIVEETSQENIYDETSINNNDFIFL